MAERDERGRVRSVETAASLLLALAGLGRAASLTEISRAAGLAPAKAHRYLASLAAAGLVAQATESRAYRLGPAALTLGAAALRQTDIVAATAEPMDAVREATGYSCFCAVLGNRGATVLRQAEAPHSVVVNVRPGSVLPLSRSATGRVLAAWLDPGEILPLIAGEVGDGGSARACLDEIRRTVRTEGMARIEGTVLAGISAVAVPVFGPGGLAGALTVLGPSAGFDLRRDGGVARSLAAAARAASIALGGETGTFRTGPE